MSKHTKDELSCCPECKATIIYVRMNEGVIDQAKCDYCKYTWQAKSPSRDAAPELLACLRAYAEQYDPDGTDEVTQAAIAKAEGRS